MWDLSVLTTLVGLGGPGGLGGLGLRYSATEPINAKGMDWFLAKVWDAWEVWELWEVWDLNGLALGA